MKMAALVSRARLSMAEHIICYVWRALAREARSHFSQRKQTVAIVIRKTVLVQDFKAGKRRQSGN